MAAPNRPAGFVRVPWWVLVAVLAGACGGGGAPATTLEPSANATPAAEPTPAPEPTAAEPTPVVDPTPAAQPGELTLASGVPGDGEIALAAGGEGFLAVYLSQSGDPPPTVLGRRLSPTGEPLDPEPFVIGSRADLEAEQPSVAGGFAMLRAGFDGSSYQVLWFVDRLVEIVREVRILARTVEPTGAPLGPLASPYYNLALSRMCNGVTSGPLALGRRGADLLLFWVVGTDCLLGPLTPGEVRAELSRLEDGKLLSASTEPALRVDHFEPAGALLDSSAALAGRERDALVAFVPEPQGRFKGELLGVWLVGEQAVLLELAGVAAVPAVASDGDGYLVVWRSPAEAGGGDELRAARFLSDEQRLDDPAGTVLAAAPGIDRPRLVALGPGRYLLVHVEDAPDGGASLVASRVDADGTLCVTSREVIGDGDEVLGLELATTGASTLALIARPDGAESFALTAHVLP